MARYFALLALTLFANMTMADESRTSIYAGFYDADPDGGAYAGVGIGNSVQFNELEYGTNRDIRQLAFYSTYQVPLFRDYVHALVGLGFANFLLDDDDFWTRLTPDVALIKGGVNARVFGPLYVEAFAENSYFGTDRADYKIQLRFNF